MLPRKLYFSPKNFEHTTGQIIKSYTLTITVIDNDLRMKKLSRKELKRFDRSLLRRTKSQTYFATAIENYVHSLIARKIFTFAYAQKKIHLNLPK